MATTDVSPFIAWHLTCDECADPATVIYVFKTDVDTYRRWRDRLDDTSIPMAEQVAAQEDWLNDPSPARWHVRCDKHYPGDDGIMWSAQGLTSRRAATDVIRHLAEKEWVGRETEWGELAVRLLAPVEAALPRGIAW